MHREQISQREIGENIAIVEKEGLLTQGTPGIANPSSGIEQKRLMKNPKLAVTVAELAPKDLRKSFRKMMGIECQSSRPCRNQTVESKCQKRLVKDRHQRLG